MAEEEKTVQNKQSLDSSEPETEEKPESAAGELVAIQRLIQTHLEKVETLREEAKKYAEMLADILLSSGVYSEHEQAAKEAIKTKNITKKDLLKDPGAQEIAQKLKIAKSEMKEHQASLTHFVTEYAKITGANQIEDLNGEIRDIVYSAKLVKKK